MGLDVGRGRVGAHQRHVVEGRQQDAAVEGVEVEVLLELEVVGRRAPAGRRARAWPRSCTPPGRRAGSRASRRPTASMPACTPSAQASASGTMCSKAAGVMTCSRVAFIAAIDRPLPARVPPMPPTSMSSSSTDRAIRSAISAGEAEGAARDAAADRLADDEQVGVQVVRAGVAAGAGADGVGLVVDEQGAVAGRELAHALVVAVVGQHDADVGQGRLDEDRGDVTVGERPLERLEVVELHDAGGLGGRHRCADVAGSVDGGPPSPRVAKASSTEPW